MNKFLVFLFFGLLVIGAAEWDIHKQVFQPIRKLDQFWVKFCLGNAGVKVDQPAVTTVRITENFKPESFTDDILDQPSAANAQFSRLDYATFLYSLSKYQTRSVAFLPTPTFDDDSALTGASIFPLRNASLRLPRMIVATVVSDDGKPSNPAEDVQYTSVSFEGDISELPPITRTIVPADPEVLINGDVAFSRFKSDNLVDFGRSRFQLIARQNDSVVIGFVLAAVARHANIPHSKIQVNLDGDRPAISVGEQYRIPIGRDGSMKMPSQAGLSESIYTVSVSDKGREIRDYRYASLDADLLPMGIERLSSVSRSIYEKLEYQFESLSQNLVLIGFDRSSDRIIETQNGELLSPAIATARAIATIQSKRHTQIWPIWLRAINYVVIFLIAALLLRMGRVSSLLTPIVLVFFLAILVMIFRQTLTWVPIAATLCLFGLLFLFALTAKSKKRQADEELEPQSIVA